MKNKKIGIAAFSLIELMVVITIVALLAAIATPAYQRYMFSSRLATILPVMDNIAERMIAYANINGRFPVPYDLGMNDISDSVVVKADYLPAHIDHMGFQDLSRWGFWDPDAMCGARARIDAWTSSGSQATSWYGSLVSQGFVWFDCILYNSNNVIRKKCFYGLGDGEHSLSGQFIPGWENYSTGSNYDYSNLTSFTDSAEFLGATCLQ